MMSTAGLTKALEKQGTPEREKNRDKAWEEWQLPWGCLSCLSRQKDETQIMEIKKGIGPA